MINEIAFPIQSQNTAIVLNGQRCALSHIFSSETWLNYDNIFIADGAWDDFILTDVGLHLLATAAEKINVLGDGDSIINRPKRFIYTPNQNYTDFEKVVRYTLEQSIQCADVFWASGGEMDHFLGNLSVAAKYAHTLSLRFFDEKQCYFFLSQTLQPHVCLTGIVQKTMSLYPFPRATVSSQGLRYPLKRLNLDLAVQQSLRNCADSDRVELTLSAGALWVFVAY